MIMLEISKARFNPFNKSTKLQYKQSRGRDRVQRQLEERIICQFHQHQHICNSELLKYRYYPTHKRKINNRDNVKDQYLQNTREQMNLKRMTFWKKQYLEQQCHIYHHTKPTQKQHNEHGKIEDTIQQAITL
ncbi:MAG: hypothetical protein EZS28_010403 [Streblomastix strix]|uniref:Uncharacterized protein n=1 Tax=Streblomastix strix TaxID=222440 RepID=A0A5J4WGC5_9EUKA|nr:MAG: hypothetical protein EZS28_010403 [Streblomastix strix]